MNKNEKFNLIFYDIETIGFNLENSEFDEKGHITSISVNDTVYTVGYNVDSEEKLLDQVKHIFMDKNNILVAWNGSGFDDKIIRTKIKNIKCKFLDLMKFYGKIIKNKTIKNRFYSLNSVANHIGLNKDDINPEKSYTNKESKKLAKYNLQDVHIMQEIDKEYEITPIVLSLMETTSIKEPNDLLGVTKPLESYIKKNNIKIKSCKSKNECFNLGGLNYKNPEYSLCYNLSHYDVNSFYPSLILALNGSSSYDYPEIKYYTVEELPEDVKQFNDKLYFNEDGTKQVKQIHKDKYQVCELTKPFNIENLEMDYARLTSKLLKYKRESEGNERATYKMLVNGLYGAMDSKYFKYQHKHLASAVTFMSRLILYNTIKKFNAVYGKTDSIWVYSFYTREKIENYTKELLKKHGLKSEYHNDYLIKWELETEVDQLLIKDYNNYAEKIGKKYNFKGQFETPIQKMILKKYMENQELTSYDVETFYNENKKDIGLFCKYIKLSEKQLGQERFNLNLSNLLQYPYTIGYKTYNYKSIIGYCNSETLTSFKIPVDKQYALELMIKTLNNYGANIKQEKEPITEKEPIFVPMFKPKDSDRLIIDKKAVKKLFKEYGKPKEEDITMGVDFFKNIKIPQDWVNLQDKTQLKGIELINNYYAFDLDYKIFKKDIEKIKDKLLKNFKEECILQQTKSKGYHIIFKTKQDLTNLKTKVDDTESTYKGLELKYNNLLPFDCHKYTVMHGNINNLKNLTNTGFIKEIMTEKPAKEYDLTDNESRQTSYDNDKLDKISELLIKFAETIQKNKTTNRNHLQSQIGFGLKKYIVKEDFEYLVDELLESEAIENDNNAKGTLIGAYDKGDNRGLVTLYALKDKEANKYLKELNSILNNEENDKNIKTLEKTAEEEKDKIEIGSNTYEKHTLKTRLNYNGKEYTIQYFKTITKGFYDKFYLIENINEKEVNLEINTYKHFIIMKKKRKTIN